MGELKAGTKMQPPGPGKYDMTVSAFAKRSAAVFGSEKRDKPEGRVKTKVPGPGAYSANLAVGMSKAPRFGYFDTQKSEDRFGSEKRLAKTITGIAPGPGAYEPRPERLDKRAPALVMGSSLREVQHKKVLNVPGPGAYTAAEKAVGGPKFGFGTSLREPTKKGKNEVAGPGPGSYTVPEKFAELPGYERASMTKTKA